MLGGTSLSGGTCIQGVIVEVPIKNFPLMRKVSPQVTEGEIRRLAADSRGRLSLRCIYRFNCREWIYPFRKVGLRRANTVRPYDKTLCYNDCSLSKRY